MASVQSVWGIDVGRCALKAIRLRPAADGKVEILGFEHIEHDKILSQPDADRPALIGSALEKFLSHNDISKDQVVVSVPGQQTLARFTKLPPVAAKRIPDIVQYEADQQIPFDMDEVIWDYHVFQQEGVPDPQVGIFAMKRELIREHLLHFEQAAIEPIAVQSGPLAIYNAALFDELLGEETTILLDIGAENTDLVIATTESLWTRTVPVGGNSLTEALVKSFKLSFSKAESLKRTAATSKYARQIFQAMRPVFADLVQELQRSIGFYTTNRREARVEKVIAVGNAFQLPGLQKYLQQNLSLPVERPGDFKNVVPSAVVADEKFKEQILSMATAYGLALQGLGLTKVSSNLLPAEIAKQAVWRKKRPAFAASAACLLLAGGLVWFRQASDMSALAASSEGISEVAVGEDQAARILSGAESLASLSDRARAESVVQAGAAMKRRLSQLSGQGNEERTAAETLIGIQRAKALIPEIFRVIHESAPSEEGMLATAKTQEEALQAIARGDVPPRGERKALKIVSLDMNYEPDLKAYTWDSVIDVPPPINSHDLDEGDELPGMYIKIACSTPNAGGLSYIRDTFLEALRRNGRRPGKGFYFDHIIVYDGSKFDIYGNSESPGQIDLGLSRSGRGRGVELDPRVVDVFTNESREEDWQFEVWADVIMEDFPEEILDQGQEDYEDEEVADQDGAEDGG